MSKLKQPDTPTPLSFRKKLSDHWKLFRKKAEIYREWEATWQADRKDFQEVWRDLVCLIWKYDVPFRMLFPGYWEEHMHKKGRTPEQHVIWKEWNAWRSFLDWQCGEEYKKLYSKEETLDLFNEHGIPCPSHVGFLIWDKEQGKARFQQNERQTSSLTEALQEYGGLFVKPDDLVQGIGCAKIQLSETGSILLDDKPTSEEGLSILFAKTEKLQAERLVIQHRDLAAFHPNSVNTLRIITMKDSSGNITVNRSLLRMGIGGRCVDNWCTGGLAVKINRDGTLSEYAWFEKPTQGPQTEHPDTGVTFKGYKLPYWDESVQLALHAHRALVPNLFSVGWDVAITPTGPILIEANPNFSIFQPICGGLRPMLTQYVKPMCRAVMAGEKPLIHFSQD